MPTIIDDLENRLENPKPYKFTFSRIRSMLYDEIRKEAISDRYVFEIEKEVLLRCIQDSIRYQSFQDAKT